jgi:hypothetical protein
LLKNEQRIDDKKKKEITERRRDKLPRKGFLNPL